MHCTAGSLVGRSVPWMLVSLPSEASSILTPMSVPSGTPLDLPHSEAAGRNGRSTPSISAPVTSIGASGSSTMS